MSSGLTRWVTTTVTSGSAGFAAAADDLLGARAVDKMTADLQAAPAGWRC